MAGCEPTYEGLKAWWALAGEVDSAGCEPTSGGLKAWWALAGEVDSAGLRAYL